MRILVATSGAYDPKRDAQHSAFAFPWPQGSEIHVLTVAEVTYATVAALDPEAIDTASVEIPDANDARAIANTAALRFRDQIDAIGDAHQQRRERACRVHNEPSSGGVTYRGGRRRRFAGRRCRYGVEIVRLARRRLIHV